MIAMRFVKPGTIIAGFHADHPDSRVPELHHVGEQWAPREHAIPRHAHAVWELYLQLDGTSIWHDAAGRTYRCPPGAFFAPSPRTEHWLGRTTGSKHHFYFAAIDVEAALSQQEFAPLVSAWAKWRRQAVHIVNARSIEPAFRSLIRETSIEKPFRALGMRTALEALLIDATRLLTAPNTGRPLVAEPLAVEEVRRVLDEHPGERWRLQDLGRLTGLSPNHLALLFFNATGLTPYRYLHRSRIERARDLLRNTDASITVIAHQTGFGSSQHFARAFRDATGKTPTDLRTRRHPSHSKSARTREK